jgi:cytochrome oxidase Cu insertion factor (SCO1/SenC/PrrC family)
MSYRVLNPSRYEKRGWGTQSVAAVAGAVAALALSVAFTAPVFAHGSAALRDDACAKRAGLYYVHFSAYQPNFNPYEQYCEATGAEGDALVVLDLIGTGADTLPVSVKVLDVTANGEHPVLELPSRRYRGGIVNFHFDLQAGHSYMTAVTLGEPPRSYTVNYTIRVATWWDRVVSAVGQVAGIGTYILLVLIAGLLYALYGMKSTASILLVSALAALVSMTSSACIDGGGPVNAPVGGPGLTRTAGLQLIDQNNQPVALESFKGRSTVIGFMDTACPGPCKLLTNKVHMVYKRLEPSEGAQVNFVLISYNALHDTPSRLKAYARDMGLEPLGWHLLTGSPSEIDQVLHLFGLPPISAFSGSMEMMDALDYVFLLDREGRILSRYKAAPFKTEQLASDLRQTLGSDVSALRSTSPPS